MIDCLVQCFVAGKHAVVLHQKAQAQLVRRQRVRLHVRIRAPHILQRTQLYRALRSCALAGWRGGPGTLSSFHRREWMHGGAVHAAQMARGMSASE